MITSAEIRWFFQGIINNDVLLFFKENQTVFQEEQPRTDWYLLNNDQLSGIKLRNTHFEIKKFINSLENLRINPEVRGNAGIWNKYSFEINPGEDHQQIIDGKNQQWLGVYKKRSVIRYEILNDGRVRTYSGNELTEGCTMEICFIKTMKLDFWTLGFETSGSEDTAGRNLELVTQHVFRDTARLSLFKTENSFGYPEFLQKLSML